MLDEEKRQLLQAILAEKHPTTRELQQRVLPSLSLRTVRLKLQELVAAGYIDAHLLYPERGNGSERYFHLLMKGMKALGGEKLGNQHYRPEVRDFHQHSNMRFELRYVLAEMGWTLYEQEEDCLHALLRYVQIKAHAQHSEAFSPSQLISLIKRPSANRKRTKEREQRGATLGKPVRYITPDMVIETTTTTVLCIIAHPHATTLFWKERLRKYEQLFRTTGIRCVCIALNERMREDCEQVMHHSPFRTAVLIVTPDSIHTLFTKLGK